LLKTVPTSQTPDEASLSISPELASLSLSRATSIPVLIIGYYVEPFIVPKTTTPSRAEHSTDMTLQRLDVLQSMVNAIVRKEFLVKEPSANSPAAARNWKSSPRNEQGNRENTTHLQQQTTHFHSRRNQ